MGRPKKIVTKNGTHTFTKVKTMKKRSPLQKIYEEMTTINNEVMGLTQRTGRMQQQILEFMKDGQ